jgi:hypothetical protein
MTQRPQRPALASFNSEANFGLQISRRFFSIIFAKKQKSFHNFFLLFALIALIKFHLDAAAMIHASARRADWVG